jgi:1-deoxy-D-xylulose-5-phosphate synthase
MIALLRAALDYTKGPFSIRYPRDAAPDAVPAATTIPAASLGTWEVLRQGGDYAILAVGTTVLPALAAAEQVAADGIECTVVNCRYLKPYDEVTLTAIVAQHKRVLVVEEGTVINGFGAFMSTVIERVDPAVRVAVHGVPDRFVEQAPRQRQLELAGLDAGGIARRIRALHETEALTG